VSGRGKIVLGAVSFAPALAPEIIDRMAESIVDLLVKLGEVEAERDFYKAAAGKLAKRRRNK
jgi:hypothetical protein